jgi:activating signal cointegrator complex subunit 3
VSWTYFYRRLCSNPHYYISKKKDGNNGYSGVDGADVVDAYSDPAGFRQMLSDYVWQMISSSVQDLVNAKCIAVAANKDDDGDVLESLPLGRVASLYYLNHKTAYQLHMLFTMFSCSSSGDDGDGGGSVVPWHILLWELCRCPELSQVPVRHNEDKMNSALALDCPLKVPDANELFSSSSAAAASGLCRLSDYQDQYTRQSSSDSPHYKSFLLLQCHMWGIKFPISDYRSDCKSVLDNVARIIQVMIMTVFIYLNFRLC